MADDSLLDSVFGGGSRGYVDDVFGESEEERRRRQRRLEDAAVGGADRDVLGDTARRYRGEPTVEREATPSRLRSLEEAPPEAPPLTGPGADRTLEGVRARARRRTWERDEEIIAEQNDAAMPRAAAAEEVRREMIGVGGRTVEDIFAIDPSQVPEVATKWAQNLDDRLGRIAGGMIQAVPEIAASMSLSQQAMHNLIPPEVRDGPAERWLRSTGRGIFERATAELERNDPNVAGALRFGYDLANAFVDLSAAVGVTAATRSPTVGAATIGVQVFGDQYGDSVASGRSERQALMDASFYGLAEFLGERFVIGRLMQPGGRVARIGSGAAAEGMQEFVTEGLQTAYDAGIIGENMSLGEALDRMAYAGLIGAGAGAGIGAISGPAARRVNRAETEIDGVAVDLIDPAKEDLLTPSDRASPLDDALIAEGRSIIERSPHVATPRRRREPPVENAFDRMVQITLGAESGNRDLNPDGSVVTSPAGARGRMQVLDSTNTDPGYGVRPAQNDSLAERARVGRDYLAALLRHYGGDPARMWGAYNWGPGNLDNAIRQHGANWLEHAPPETQRYVMRNLNRLGGHGFDGEGNLRSIPDEEVAAAQRPEETAEGFVSRILGDDFGVEEPSTAERRTAELDAARLPEPPAPTPGTPLPPPLEGAPEAPVSAAAPAAVPVEPQAPSAYEGADEVRRASEAILGPIRENAERYRQEASTVIPNVAPEIIQAIRSRIASAAPGDSIRVEPNEGDALRSAGARIDETNFLPVAYIDAIRGDDASPAPAVPEARQRFDPAALIPQLRQYVAGRGSLDLKTIAKKLGVTKAQAERAVGALASRPDSGIFLSRSGKVRRVAVARGPIDAIRFLRNRGGITPEVGGSSKGHGLTKGRNWHLAAPGLISRNGMTIDEAGEALHEAGFFPNRPIDDRPTESEVLEFIENAFTNRSYRADDLEAVQEREGSAESKKGLENATYAVRDLAENLGLDLAETEIADATDYIAAGETVEIAVQMALNDASARAFYEGADETGRDFYESLAESIYVGETAEDRGGADEAGLGPEGVEGDAGERAPPSDESGEDVAPVEGAEQEVETRAGASPEGGAQPTPTTATRPQPDSPESRRAKVEGHPAYGLKGDAVERLELPGRHENGVPLADIGVGQGTDGKWYSRFGYMISGDGVGSPITHSPGFGSRQDAIDRAAIEIRLHALRDMNQTKEDDEKARKTRDKEARKADDWAREQMSFDASAYDLSQEIENALIGEFTEEREKARGEKPVADPNADPQAESERVARALIANGYHTGGGGKGYSYSVDQAGSVAKGLNSTPGKVHVRLEGQEPRTFNYQKWPQWTGPAYGDFKLKHSVDSKERAIRTILARRADEAVEDAAAPEKSPVDDMFGVQPGDERRALERAAEGRKKGKVGQKAAGEDGGLFDTRETTADLTQVESKAVEAPKNQPDSFTADERAALEAAVKRESKGSADHANATAMLKRGRPSSRPNIARVEGEVLERAQAAMEPAATGYGSKNRLVTANRAAELRTRLKAKLSGAQLNAGLDPELIALGTELAVFHIEAGARSFADFTRKIADDLGMKLDALKPYLRGWYNGARDFMEDQGESIDGMDGPGAVKAAITMIEDSQSSENRNMEGDDVRATGEPLESDSGGATAEDGVGATPVPPVAGEAGLGTRSGDLAAEGSRSERPAGEASVPDAGTPPVGERGDSGVRIESPGARRGAEERRGSERGGDLGEPGRAAGHVPTAAVARTASGSANVEAKRAAQRAANSVAIKPGDIDNIRETLPYLKPTQQDDVLIIEQRYARPEGHGMLITNGTGTGKTFVGGGVIARMVRQGQTEHLVVAPSQDILESWKAALAELGVDASILEGVDDAGAGVSLTTFANFYQNMALLDRDFGLVVPDEAQKLSANKEGETTDALKMLRAITNHPRGRWDRAQMVLRDEWAKFDGKRDGWSLDKKRAYEALYDKTRALADSYDGKPRAKTLFLSATPFAYVETVDWAEGYLFSYGPEIQTSRYNQPNSMQAFFIQHFGYRMRNNKLTKPEAEVDSGVMEREFHEWLKREGALSGRVLDVDADYDRRFVLVDDAIGNQIDQALDFLSSTEGGKFKPIYDLVSKKFDYLSRMRLLEAIKAQHAIPMIREYHRLGRKVAVFHDYNEGGGFSPFILNLDPDQTIEVYRDNKPVTVNPYELYREFLARNPYVERLDFAKLPSPLVTLGKAFPDAVIYNGTVPPKKRRQGKDSFNQDGPDTPNLIIIQSAAGEYGIGVHDTTGKHMRMTIDLAMTVRPTSNIQKEGRTLREGSVTNAGFRYLNTGTAWERWTFAGKIAERAGTAENLALGNMARHLRQSFIDAFNDSATFEATENDGVGGKAADRANNMLTPFQRAKTHYYAQQKKTGRRDQREGLDYFATPEPVGYKMVEWANIAFGEKALEPSVGHGAIARFFPETADRTLIEPSSELLSRAALASPGARTQDIRFEDLHVTNKFDAIVMNPPFGLGGKTAIEHLAKAARHLRNGGRIVALIPEGPAANKRFDAWFESDSAEALFLVSSISLPASTFERAGTKVMTRIVVIDRQADAAVAARIQQSNRDVSDAETIGKLFDRIEEMSIPDRLTPTTAEEAAPSQFTLADLAAIRTAAGDVTVTEKPVFETAETKHGKTGEALFVATVTERVERETYDAILAKAKAHGGYYSWYNAGGAIPGFQFKSAADRETFIDEAGTARSSVQEERWPWSEIAPFPETITPSVARRGATMMAEEADDTQRGRFFEEDAATRTAADESDAAELARLEARGGRIFTNDEKLASRPPEPERVAETRAPQTPAQLAERAEFFRQDENQRARWDAEGRGQRTLFSRTDGEAMPRFNEKITTAIQREVKRLGIGDRVVLNTVDVLFGDSRVAGAYQFGIITLALDNPQKPTFTFNHEAVHALKDLGLFKGDEWRALERQAKADGTLMNKVRRRYADDALTEEQLVEEAVAEMYARWRQGRLESGFVRAALQRIRDFFTAIHRAIGKAGVEDDVRAEAETVMRRIEGGEVGTRRGVADYWVPGEFGLIGPPRFSRTEDEDGTPATRWLLSEGTADSIRERVDVWRTRLQDRMLPLLRTQQRIEAQTGDVLPEGLNPYLAEELMSGKVGSRLEKLTRDMVEPLGEAMKKESINVAELETWLYARHAPERNARIAEINPNFEEGTGSGMTDAEAVAIMAAADEEGKTPGLERLAKRIDAIIKFALDTRVEAGLLTESEADVWRDRYEYYVPLRGLAEVDPEASSDRPSYGGGINVRGPESRRAFGRKSKASNILAYSLLQAEEAIVRAGINDVGQAFYELAHANPDSNFWKVDKISRKPVLDRETGQVYYRSDSKLTAEDAPYTVSLKIDGQEHRVTMNRDNAAAVKLAAAMRNLHGTQLSGVMRAMSAINRFLSTVNTTLSPEFVITNAFRDIQTAGINLTGAEVDGLTRATLRDYKSALTASTKGAFGKEDGEWGKWYREFVDEGGRVYFNRIEDLNELQRRVEKQLRQATGGLSAVRAGGAALFKFVENVNLGVENAIRLAAYKNAREHGMSRAKAASLAKNLTVNFNRRGEWGTAMNALYLFYNASVQGSVRVLQAMKSKRVRRILYAAIATGAVLDMLNSMISGDDDDGESFYDKISDFDKSRNLIFMIPGGGGRFFKVPLPYGYNVFFAMGRTGSEIARGRRWTDSAGTLLSTIVDSFNPVGGTNSLLNFIAPTVADPLVDLSRNRDFADRPIAPEPNAHGPQEPNSQRYWGSISPHWRIVTDLLNTGTGGDRVVPGLIDLSPEWLEHIGGVVTGAAGNFYIDRVGGLMEKVIAGEAIETNDLPLVRRVVGSPPSWYNKAAFYARVGEIEQVAHNLDQYREAGQDEVADAYEDRNATLLELRSAASSAQRRMRDVRGRRGDIDHQSDLGEIDGTTRQAERRELKSEEDEIIDEFNREYLSVVEHPRRP